MKAHIGRDGQVHAYGLSVEKTLNYRKHGIYANDDDPRLRPTPKRRWLKRLRP